LAVVLGVVEAAIVVDPDCDADIGLLVDVGTLELDGVGTLELDGVGTLELDGVGTLELDGVGTLELEDVLDVVDVDDVVGVVDVTDELDVIDGFDEVLVLVLVVDGGFEVATEVVEGVGCTTGGVLDVFVEVVDVKSGSGVGSAAQPPFEHTWPRAQTLQASPRVHLVPGLSQHTASDA